MTALALRRPVAIPANLPVILAAAWLAAAALNAAHLAYLVGDFTMGLHVGVDRGLYLDAATRWLGGGSFYPAGELAGPYSLTSAPVLYPPVVLVLLVPFSVLPALAWWAVPLGITAAVVAWHRPARWTWPILTAVVWYPRSQELIAWGNPAMFAMAAVAIASTGRTWAAPLVLFKASLAPFALLGIRSRSWWLGLGILAGVSALFGAMWLDWLTVLRNLTDGVGPLYSLAEMPLIGLPLIARAGSRRA